MNYTFSQKEKMVTFVLMGIGLVALVAAFADNSHRAWANLLLDNFFFMAIALFSMVFFVNAIPLSGWIWRTC